MRGKSFRELADAVHDAQAMREKVLVDTFDALERSAPSLARLLLENLRTRPRAARWMAMSQRPFGGRNAYQVLADGEVDLIWDCMLGVGADDAEPAQIRFESERRGDTRRR